MNILRPGHQLKVVFYDSKVVTVKYDVLLKVWGNLQTAFTAIFNHNGMVPEPAGQRSPGWRKNDKFFECTGGSGLRVLMDLVPAFGMVHKSLTDAGTFDSLPRT